MITYDEGGDNERAESLSQSAHLKTPNTGRKVFLRRHQGPLNRELEEKIRLDNPKLSRPCTFDPKYRPEDRQRQMTCIRFAQASFGRRDKSQFKTHSVMS